MVKQQYTVTHNLFLQENERTIFLAAYPVDLSLFLDDARVLPAQEDISTDFSMEGNEPIVVAQRALIYWNRYVASMEDIWRKAFLEAALWLVDQAQHFGSDAAGWPLTYAHPIFFTRGAWLSSIAQGCGLSVLVRAYKLTGDQHVLETAHRVAHTFELDILDGGVCTPLGKDGIFFEEVAVYPAAHTLQGCIFGLLGLIDYVANTGNLQMQQPIERSEKTLHTIIGEFDLGFWTRADLLQRSLSTPFQLAQQIALLEAIADHRICRLCTERVSHWRKYQRDSLSRLRYSTAHGVALIKQAVLKRVQAGIISHSTTENHRFSPVLRVCVPLTDYPSLGGIRTFLDRANRIMRDRWQMEYVTQDVRTGAGERVIHQFGKSWMTPWYFPQLWFYTLAGFRKLVLLMHRGANYDVIIPQDGVFSGAFAALVGKLTGTRVICIDHSDLTWYKNRSYRVERWRDLDGRAWPWLFRQLVRFLLALYWPSLYILARIATSQADHLLSPGVDGDEIDETCRDLHVPLSRMTRFNVFVDMEKYGDLSPNERESILANMGIPGDALVIMISVRLELEKGLDISIESITNALSSLPPALHDRVFVIITGDGKLRGWLEEEIQRKGLSDICRITGHVSNEKVISLLQACDISLNTSSRGVCMPASVLEGMATGCAVIASSEPLANTYVLAQERGIVVPANNVERTSKALELLLKDRNLRVRMGKAAREYIAQHHNREMFQRVLLRATYWSDFDQLLNAQSEPSDVMEKLNTMNEIISEQL